MTRADIRLRRYSFVRNSSWLLGDRAIRLLGGLFIGIWVARYLGAADFGLLSYSIAFASIFGVLSTLGLDGIFVRAACDDDIPIGELLGTAFVLRLGGAAIAMAVSLAAAAMLNASLLSIAMIAICSAAFVAQSLFVIDWLMQAESRNHLSAIAQTTGFVISSALKLFFILSNMPVIWFAISGFIEAFVAALVLGWFFWRGRDRYMLRFKVGTARALLGESWPLILSGLAYALYVRVDQIMIQYFLDDTAVGLYAAATRISELWNFIPFILVTAAFPKLLDLRKSNGAVYRTRMLDLFGLLALLTIGVAIVVSLAADWLIATAFGAQYDGAQGVLRISAWNGVFVALGFASGRWLIAEGLAKFAFVRNLIGLAVNVTLNSFMIPAYGIVGAAVSTLIAYVAANFISYAFDRRLRSLLLINFLALSLIGWFVRRRSAL